MAKNTPQRLCLGCRKMKPKDQLIRVAKQAGGDIKIDPQGKAPGRGAYLCREEQCLNKIIKSKALSRGLSAPIPPALYENLQALLQQEHPENQEVTPHV